MRPPDLKMARARHAQVAMCAAALVFVLALLISLWPARPGAGPITEGELGSRVRPDFGSTVLYPARALLDGINPYDFDDGSEYRERFPAHGSFLYSPHWLTVSLSFAAVDDVVGDKVFLVLSVAGVVALVAVGLTAAPGSLGLPALCVLSAAAFISTPVRNELSLGQAAVLVSLGFVAALAFRARSPALAGVGVFFALTKPQIGIPLLVCLFALGAWRPIIYGACGAFVVGIPAVVASSIAAGGFGDFAESVADSVRANSSETDTGVGSTSNARADLAALMRRALGWVPSDAAQLLITVAVLAVAALALHQLVRRAEPQAAREGLTWLVAIAGMLLCTVHAYDLMTLVAATALVAQEATGRRPVLAATAQRCYIGFVAFVALLIRPGVGERLGWVPPFPEPQSRMIGFATLVMFVLGVVTVLTRRPVRPTVPSSG